MLVVCRRRRRIVTYPTPPILSARRPPATEPPLFAEEAHPVRVGLAVVAGILLWLGFLLVIPMLL